MYVMTNQSLFQECCELTLQQDIKLCGPQMYFKENCSGHQSRKMLFGKDTELLYPWYDPFLPAQKEERIQRLKLYEQKERKQRKRNICNFFCQRNCPPMGSDDQNSKRKKTKTIIVYYILEDK